ncbi:hypothetical protein HMPREF9141_2579 [Prevotella multiformis DSM 16608]|uniref:Uncharacterized protein n=1 Tax=Prevotella multiformis DSM 16608 TaxID=888743 RepID=F0FAG2_9BACT|nr:hypothetical protein HMPREF9141_2579 [Prevotella multiformis DSM 16608]
MEQTGPSLFSPYGKSFAKLQKKPLSGRLLLVFNVFSARQRTGRQGSGGQPSSGRIRLQGTDRIAPAVL